MHDIIHAKRERRKREKESAPQAVFIKKKKRKDSPSFLHCVDECLLLFFGKKQKREKKKKTPASHLLLFSLLHRKNDGKSFPLFFLKQERKKTWNKIIILSLSFLLEGMDILPFSIDGSHYASSLSSFLLL